MGEEGTVPQIGFVLFVPLGLWRTSSLTAWFDLNWFSETFEDAELNVPCGIQTLCLKPALPGVPLHSDDKETQTKKKWHNQTKPLQIDRKKCAEVLFGSFSSHAHYPSVQCPLPKGTTVHVVDVMNVFNSWFRTSPPIDRCWCDVQTSVALHLHTQWRRRHIYTHEYNWMWTSHHFKILLRMQNVSWEWRLIHSSRTHTHTHTMFSGEKRWVVNPTSIPQGSFKLQRQCYWYWFAILLSGLVHSRPHKCQAECFPSLDRQCVLSVCACVYLIGYEHFDYDFQRVSLSLFFFPFHVE